MFNFYFDWETFLAVTTGVVIPLGLFYIENLRQRCKEKLAKWEADYQSLFYLAINLKGILDQVRRHEESCKEHLESIRKNPLEFHLIQIIAADRVHFDHEKLFHAYLSYFGSNEGNVKTFKNILSLVEFFDRLQS